MINKFTILGERCSGTVFLEQTILHNFDLSLTWEYGWKHFFGFNEYKDSDDTLFIGIVRDPYTWMNSLYKKPWHLEYFINEDEFLNREFYSRNSEKRWRHIWPDVKGITQRLNEEIMEDRNLFTGERYKNIFECRGIKLYYLMEEMPKKVDHYVLIRYEDLRDSFEETLKHLQQTFNLTTQEGFPNPINTYKKSNKKFSINKEYTFTKEEIYDHPDFNKEIEKKIKYL